MALDRDWGNSQTLPSSDSLLLLHQTGNEHIWFRGLNWITVQGEIQGIFPLLKQLK